MIKRTSLLFAALLTVAALAAPAAQAGPPDLPVKVGPICTYVPDLDGHVWGPVCIGV